MAEGAQWRRQQGAVATAIAWDMAIYRGSNKVS